MRRPDRFVAGSFIVAILAAFGLFFVYLEGGQTQLEGALLFLTLGGIGAGLILWAKTLMPQIVDETQSRHHAPVSEQDEEAAAETVLGGVDELKRRTFLSRLLIGAAGALGLAALFPIRSLGEVPGNTPFFTKLEARFEARRRRGEPRHDRDAEGRLVHHRVPPRVRGIGRLPGRTHQGGA